ncbi:MAG TPA: hypothetical protein VIY49_12910 [Bryobacteraceae bacterium]
MGKCIRRALKEGDRTALRLCVERVSPTRRGVALRLRLPTIRSAEDAEREVEKVTQALHRGQCTPAEATEVKKFLQAHARLLQDLQMESRLDKLERMIEDRASVLGPAHAQSGPAGAIGRSGSGGHRLSDRSSRPIKISKLE